MILSFLHHHIASQVWVYLKIMNLPAERRRPCRLGYLFLSRALFPSKGQVKLSRLSGLVR